MKYLAVDLGASSGRTIVGTIEDGKITLEETHRFVNSMEDINGEKHWDVMGLVEEITHGINAAEEVVSIGVDTWGVDYGLIDDDGKLIDKPFAYRDSRTEKAIPEVFKTVSQTELYGRTGLQHMPFNTIFQIMADKLDQPEALEKAERMLFMPELISYLLTGEMATEYTIASTSSLLDARRRDWDWELIDSLGFPRKLFGEVKQPGTKVGCYKGIPVCLPPMHDTASAVVAVPATEPGNWAFLSSGTWSLIGAEIDEPILTEASAKANFTNEGGADGRIRFLKNVNGLWLIQECRRIWASEGEDLSYGDIAGAAEVSTFAEIIDPNDPRFLAPENMPQEIKTALAEAGKPVPASMGDVARCCYLSLANAYREQLEILQDILGVTFDRLHIVGGGTKDTLLSQLTASAVGIPVVAGPVEATALGNLCLQAKADGLFEDLTEIRKCIADSFPMATFLPE